MPEEQRKTISLTTVWRSLDRKTPTNRAILIIFILTLAAGAAAMASQGMPWNEGAVYGLALAGAIFFGWAITRETDPDRWYSAFFAAAGAGVAGEWIQWRFTARNAQWIDAAYHAVGALAALPVYLACRGAGACEYAGAGAEG